MNTRLKYMVEPAFQGGPPTDTTAPSAPRGGRGTYTATFALSPGEGRFAADIDLSNAARTGASLIHLGPGNTLRYDLTDPTAPNRRHFAVVLRANTAGFLAVAEAAVFADSFAQAEETAFDGVLPVLSRISFEHNSPIGVGAYEIFENSTSIRLSSVLAEGAVVAFSGTSFGISQEDHRILLSAYREGLASGNPLYQVICFFRVIEGVRKTRATRRQNSAEVPLVAEPRERLPTMESAPPVLRESEFFESLRPHLGRKFGAVVDDYRDVLRNAIAHLDPYHDAIAADRHADVLACERALPALRYVAREMLQAELKQTAMSGPPGTETAIEPG